jgi:hypothetical protein
MRAVVQREIKHKERAREALARKYRSAQQADAAPAVADTWQLYLPQFACSVAFYKHYHARMQGRAYQEAEDSKTCFATGVGVLWDALHCDVAA